LLALTSRPDSLQAQTITMFLERSMLLRSSSAPTLSASSRMSAWQATIQRQLEALTKELKIIKTQMVRPARESCQLLSPRDVPF
jgi:hypothetical protein